MEVPVTTVHVQLYYRGTNYMYNNSVFSGTREAVLILGVSIVRDIYVICRLEGPYSEHSIFKPEVTVFHYTDRP